MRELRRDPIVDRWVIISADRPMTAIPARIIGKEEFSLFCEVNESSTPKELFAVRDDAGTRPNGPGWRLRMVPNKFPALASEGELTISSDGMYDHMSGIGVHEVLIETPIHSETLADLSSARTAELLKAVRSRFFYQPRAARRGRRAVTGRIA